MNTQLDWTQVNNDSNGNPRHVVHFLALGNNYADVLHRCKKLGGRKFHNRQYGGGIVFECVNPARKEVELLAAFGIEPNGEKISTPIYNALPNYRLIRVEFAGFGRDGVGPLMKFTDDYVPHDERVKTKTVAINNEPGEEMPQAALKKLTAAGFKVVSRCTGKSGHSFLCDNWGDNFAEIKNIK